MGKYELENLWCEGNDFHELLFTKLTGDRAEDTGAAWVVVLVDENAGVRVEAENGAVRTADRESCANDDCLNHGALFDRGGGDGVTNVSGDDIADACGAGALAEHADHFCGASAGVVSNGDFGFHLDHGGRGKGVGLVGEDFLERPALELGNRLGFDNADAVADGGFRFLIMHVVFLGALDDFVELRVGNAGDVLDDDGFLHFIGDNDAHTGLAFVLNRRCGFL